MARRTRPPFAGTTSVGTLAIRRFLRPVLPGFPRGHGKTHDDALGEVTRGVEVVEFAVGIPHLLKGKVTENVGPNGDSHSLRQPLDVVAGITPFNFPCMVPMWMFPVNRSGFPGGPAFWKDGVHGSKEDHEAVPAGAARSRRPTGA
jgi:hypothetical protein